MAEQRAGMCEEVLSSTSDSPLQNKRETFSALTTADPWNEMASGDLPTDTRTEPTMCSFTSRLLLFIIMKD